MDLNFFFSLAQDITILRQYNDKTGLDDRVNTTARLDTLTIGYTQTLDQMCNVQPK